MLEKLAFGGPFRQMLKKCLRPGRKLPARLCRAQTVDKSESTAFFIRKNE